MESFLLKLQKSDNIGRDFVDCGFKFRPNDIKLVGDYLVRKINGMSFFCEFMFKDCDLYGTQEPWEVWASHPLAGGEEELHFFTQLKKKSTNAVRTTRKVGTGTWHCESTDPVMYYEQETGTDNVLGERRRFLYKNEASVHHKGWLLHEFKLADVCTDIVVCRLKKNINGKRSRQESSSLRAEKVIRTKKRRMEILPIPSPGTNSTGDEASSIEQTENPNVVGVVEDGNLPSIDDNLMSVDEVMGLMNSVPVGLVCGSGQSDNLVVVEVKRSSSLSIATMPFLFDQTPI